MKTQSEIYDLGQKEIDYDRQLAICGKEKADNVLHFWMKGYRYGVKEPKRFEIGAVVLVNNQKRFVRENHNPKGYGISSSMDIPAEESYFVLNEFVSPVSLTEADYEEVLADHRRQVKELDVLLNGKNAAEQASLCDIISQIKSVGEYKENEHVNRLFKKYAVGEIVNKDQEIAELRSVLRELHENTLYQLSAQDIRTDRQEYSLFDKVETVLKYKQG